MCSHEPDVQAQALPSMRLSPRHGSDIHDWRRWQASGHQDCQVPPLRARGEAVNVRTTTKDLDLAIAVLDAITPPGHIWEQSEIADICGVTRTAIYLIEKKALAKLRSNDRLKSFAEEMA